MARTAQRYKKLVERKSAQIPVYRAAIYARLSVDKNEKKVESIETQVALIKEFIQTHNAKADKEYELALYDIYSDIGKTGTNFERPGFERMMKDIRERKVNCILVKDFSRFGRNYIETGNYLEKILPFMKVRFISVCDQYDSFAPDSENQDLTMNIKNLVNDAYAKDISAKERAAKRIVQKNGEYVGSKAPYGYRCKKVDGKYTLLIEPEAAKIVQRIFEEYAAGKKIQHIIDELYKEGVHRISDYDQYHHVYCQEGEKLHQWGNSSIRAVLNRNNYYGDLVQRKYESRFQKGEKGCEVLDEREWIITPAAHAPIISRELFEKAQERLKAGQEARTVVGWKKDERAFYNVFYCGECGRKMSTSRSNGSVFYFCGASRYQDERKCNYKSVSEDKIQSIVHAELNRQFQLSGLQKKNMVAMSKTAFQAKIVQIENEIKRMNVEAERQAEKFAEAFMQYKDGNLSREAYMAMRVERNDWKVFCDERKKALEQRRIEMQKRQKEETRFLKSLLDLKGTSKINAELAEALIEKIYVYDDKRLEIHFRFKGGVGV
ncbi:recombinase family protein [Clostridium fessum]|uniref:recombinase family protein n=1 Tax=Clostridium fessum TaxID=2126740 RepID=UPI0022E7B951|nr:recombinase family protein [Clostridium fessum]